MGLCMVDRELGGPGKVGDETAQIGKIEARLLTPIIGLIINEWCSMWRDLMEIRPSVMGHEINSRYLETSSPETIMLVVGVQMTLGETVEQLQFAFPHHMLEPLTLKLTTEANRAEKKDTAAASAPVKWNGLMENVLIGIHAELPEIELFAREVAVFEARRHFALPRGIHEPGAIAPGFQSGIHGDLGLQRPEARRED